MSGPTPAISKAVRARHRLGGERLLHPRRSQHSIDHRAVAPKRNSSPAEGPQLTQGAPTERSIETAHRSLAEIPHRVLATTRQRRPLCIPSKRT